MILDGMDSFCGAGVCSGLIEGWKRRGIERLLPLQRRVAVETDLMRGGSVMVVAPASSGKTMAAEIAMAIPLSQGKKAFYLVPAKALAEEKLAAFERWLEPAGLRAVCATRDRPETDARIASGDFDLAVAVYEKMNHYMTTLPQVLGAAGAVVVDEVQMLGEAGRGAVLDLLLTKIRLSPYRARIVALAPEMTGAKDLAAWLGCALIEDPRRPRELREGVLDPATGLFRYRSVNAGEEGEEKLAEPGELENRIGELAGSEEAPVEVHAAALLAAAVHLTRRGEQALVFAPTRGASRLWAGRLAQWGVGADPARLALARLAQCETGLAARWMRDCLAKGTAFHNADLQAELRASIEQAFNEGEIRALVATPTLGLGVNLAARNVLQCAWRMEGEAGRGAPIWAPLGRGRFANQGGRAARFGWGREAGRSMAVAAAPGEAERLWNELVLARAEPLGVPLGRTPATMIVLNLLGGEVQRTAENLREAAGKTFSARQGDREGSKPAFRPEIDRAIAVCREADLIAAASGSDLLSLTGLGEAAACLGISVATMGMLRRELETGFLAGPSLADHQILDLFFALALTAEGQRATAGSAPALGRGVGRNARGVHEWIDEMPEASPIRKALGRGGGPSRREGAAWAAACLLSDWIGAAPTEEIEEKYGVYYGGLMKLGGDFAWLVGAAASIAEILGCDREKIRSLRALTERTAAGVQDRGLGLARMRVGALARGAIERLVREGFDSPEAIAEGKRENLVACVGQDLAAELEQAARKARRRVRKSARPLAMEFKPGPLTASIHGGTQRSHSGEIGDGSLRINLRSPGLVHAEGKGVMLPPLSFQLLAALAEHPGEVVTRQSLYSRLWPEGGPEEQQLDNHRRNLVRRLRPALGADRARRITQVVRGVGFRLTCPPDRVELIRP